MGILRQISVNGVDMYTNLDELAKLQEKYPLVEFGILLSEHWEENGIRYINPNKLEEIKKYGLNLSAHLCGKIAREAAKGNMKPTLNLCSGTFGMFKRMQVNIAPYKYDELIVEKVENIQEIIIQQRSDMKLFLNYQAQNHRNDVVVLIDNSGGLGVEAETKIYNNIGKVGYAGGLNPNNIYTKTRELLKCDGEFWIDMESGVRSDIDGINRFDTKKVEDVLKTVYSLLNEDSTIQYEDIKPWINENLDN